MPKRTLYLAILIASLSLAACGQIDCALGKLSDAGPGSGIPAPPDVAAPPADAQRSPSGLAWKIVTPGKGTRHPRPNSDVTVHYTGWTTDGKMFESSVQRGKPVSFGLNRVIAGWTEGVQMMVEGETRRFWIPEDLAYGKSSNPDSPKGMLVFDIELIRIDS
ncbi:MAG TPA: FKBP-type peptidyl-prolyl cis-trans isomerase [Vicinamibacterales bacterium]|nr:FKBP-type peptidyl-prolyl cis-trans isomerase [Vicinamibacterales bacterium]